MVPAPPAKPLARATSSASNKLNTSNKFVPRNPQYAATPVNVKPVVRTSLPVKPRVAASSAAPARGPMKPRISVNTQAAANPRVKLLQRQLASDKPEIKPAKSSSVTPGLKPRISKNNYNYTTNNLNKRFSRLDASSQRSNDGQSDAGQKLDLANLLDQHKGKKLIKVGGNSLNSSLNAPLKPKVALSEVAGRASFIGKGLGNKLNILN